MTPAYRVLFDGADVTRLIEDRLMFLSVHDQVGDTSDYVELVVDDRALTDDRGNTIGHLSLPPKGAEMEVWMGYKETGLVLMGLYRVDELEIGFAPHREITIRARAADTRDRIIFPRFKAPRSRSWHRKTVDEIVDAIAKEHGFTPFVARELSGHLFEHEDQTRESDLNLLHRLARKIGGISKATNGWLMIVKPGTSEMRSGNALPSIELKLEDITEGRVQLADRANYKTVRALWLDKGTARQVPVDVGSGEPRYEMKHTYPNEREARRAAKGQLDAFRRGTGLLRLSMPGDPRIGAETRINLKGFRDGVDGPWVVQVAKHNQGDDAYHLQIEAEYPD